MLISFEEVTKIVNSKNITIRGILHLGAHDCEEFDAYIKEGIQKENIIWIDALQEKITQAQERFIPNVFQACLYSETGKEVSFNITNNGQSSSILPLAKHKDYYPYIVVVETRNLLTSRLDDFIKNNKLTLENHNFWNLDLQGVEFEVLKGAGEFIKYADVIYLEVNFAELYEGISLFSEIDKFLNEQGFTHIVTRKVPQEWGDALYIRI